MENGDNKSKVFTRVMQVVVVLTALFFIVSILYTVSSGEFGSSGGRIGAVCEDGWESTSTGSGTCSWHGGVDYWLYGTASDSTYEEHKLIDDVWPIVILMTIISVILIRIHYYFEDKNFTKGRISFKKQLKSYFEDFQSNYTEYKQFFNKDYSNHTLVSDERSSLLNLRITYCIGRSEYLSNSENYNVNFTGDWLEETLFDSFNYQFNLVTILILLFGFTLYISPMLWISIFAIGIIYSLAHGFYYKLNYKRCQALCDKMILELVGIEGDING